MQFLTRNFALHIKSSGDIAASALEDINFRTLRLEALVSVDSKRAMHCHLAPAVYRID